MRTPAQQMFEDTLTLVMLICLSFLLWNSSDPKGKYSFYAFIMKFFCICIVYLLPPSPFAWYNCSGCLGVKHQLTYLLPPSPGISVPARTFSETTHVFSMFNQASKRHYHPGRAWSRQCCRWAVCATGRSAPASTGGSAPEWGPPSWTSPPDGTEEKKEQVYSAGLICSEPGNSASLFVASFPNSSTWKGEKKKNKRTVHHRVNPAWVCDLGTTSFSCTWRQYLCVEASFSNLSAWWERKKRTGVYTAKI